MLFYPEKYEFPKMWMCCEELVFVRWDFLRPDKKHTLFVCCFIVFTKWLSRVVSHFSLAWELSHPRVMTSVLHLRTLKIKEGMWHNSHWAEKRWESQWVLWLHVQCFLDRPLLVDRSPTTPMLVKSMVVKYFSSGQHTNVICKVFKVK